MNLKSLENDYEEEELEKKGEDWVFQKSQSKKSSNLKNYFIVEKILDKKIEKNRLKYKIKWLNYPMNQCKFFL